MHVRLDHTGSTAEQRLKALQQISHVLLHERNILTSVTRYPPQERKLPEPSIRLCITAKHTTADIDKLVAALKAVVADTLQTLPASSSAATTAAAPSERSTSSSAVKAIVEQPASKPAVAADTKKETRTTPRRKRAEQ